MRQTLCAFIQDTFQIEYHAREKDFPFVYLILIYERWSFHKSCKIFYMIINRTELDGIVARAKPRVYVSQDFYIFLSLEKFNTILRILHFRHYIQDKNVLKQMIFQENLFCISLGRLLDFIFRSRYFRIISLVPSRLCMYI